MAAASYRASGGIRNTVPPERLAKTDLVTGMNIDLGEDGVVMRRKGTTKLIAGTNTHSLYSLGDSGLMVQSGVLKRFFPSGTSEALRSGITGTRVSYASIMDVVYWSDGIQNGVFDSGVMHGWGLTPPPTPLVSTTVGALMAGRYSVVTTYVRDDGHESGAGQSTQVDLADNGALMVTLTPSSDANVVAHRVYVTTPNGEILYRYGEYAYTATSAMVASPVETELPLRTQFMGPPPAGQLVALFAGRMYVAKDNFLFYTQPFEYELCDLRYGFVPFEDRITMVAPVSNGIFLGTSTQVIFLQGRTPEEFKPSDVYSFGVVEGTALVTKGDDVVKDGQPDPCAMWLSTDGICVGQAVGQSANLTGTVKNLTAERYATTISARTGASVLKLRDGTPHFVVSFS